VQQVVHSVLLGLDSLVDCADREGLVRFGDDELVAVLEHGRLLQLVFDLAEPLLEQLLSEWPTSFVMR
jgi:hypothetical protein